VLIFALDIEIHFTPQPPGAYGRTNASGNQRRVVQGSICTLFFCCFSSLLSKTLGHLLGISSVALAVAGGHGL
jgi:hypothetical protein